MFYNIALRTGIALNFIAIISNMLICFINDESRWNGQMKTISSKCRNIGLIYVALAWFVGNGEFVTAGRDTYAQVAYWMQIFSSGWIIGHVVFKTLEKRWRSFWKSVGVCIIVFCDCLFNSLNEKNPVQWILLIQNILRWFQCGLNQNNMQNCH